MASSETTPLDHMALTSGNSLITIRKAQEQRLEQLVNYDELTGHFNKKRLREALDHLLASSLRSGHPGCFEHFLRRARGKLKRLAANSSHDAFCKLSSLAGR